MGEQQKGEKRMDRWMDRWNSWIDGQDDGGDDNGAQKKLFAVQIFVCILCYYCTTFIDDLIYNV